MTDESHPEHSIPRLVSRAAASLRERFGVEPTHGAAAPGRVNLIGEHTDYNGGFVLPMAIDRACVAVGARSRDPEMSRALAVDLNLSVRAPFQNGMVSSRRLVPMVEGSKVRVGSWAGYVLGPVTNISYCARAKGKEAFAVDIAVTSSVPLGSGLSSSASVEVAAATLAEGLWGSTIPASIKAGLCRDAEHDFGGVPCGIMDQWVSAMGVDGHALLIDCRTGESEAVPMPAEDRAVVVVMNTGVRHALASGEYAVRRETCRAAAMKLGVKELRDATAALLRARISALSEVELKRARHVIGENERTLAAVAALRAGDLAVFGQLMNESHESLRRDYQVSCAELDTLVDAAREVPGVFGARMTGGGFGGCAIALASPMAVVALVDRVRGRFRDVHGAECEIFSTRACAGAHALHL